MAVILPDENIVYDVPHAAKVLDLSDRRMWALVSAGTVESFKMGNSRRITRAALVAYVNACQVAA